MSPFIRNGDIVQVIPVKGKIHPGDIILYRSPHGGPIIHRVIQRDKESIITKGDSLSKPDQPLLPKQVLGRVVAVEKNGWHIRLDTRRGKILNILLATISPFSFLIYPSLTFMKPVGFLVAPALHRLSKF